MLRVARVPCLQLRLADRLIYITHVAVVSPNGAGKTTLVNMLVGLLLPTTGRALVGGVDITQVHSKSHQRLPTPSSSPPLFLFHLLLYLLFHSLQRSSAINYFPPLHVQIVWVHSSLRLECVQVAESHRLVSAIRRPL